MKAEKFDLVVIGAGWAGLIAASTYLRLAPTTKLLIADDSKSIGGVWNDEGIYPNLFAQVGHGLFEYSDHPMKAKGLTADRYISGNTINEYLREFTERNNMIGAIRLQTKVKSIKKQTNKAFNWLVTIDGDKQESFIECRKLIVASGASSGPLAEIKDPRIRRVVVLGAAKSAYDTVFLMLKQGKKVDWVIRADGMGPLSIMPPLLFGCLNTIDVMSTRAFACFSPAIQQTNGLWYHVLQRTWAGRQFTRLVWRIVTYLAEYHADYSRNDNVEKLRPVPTGYGHFWANSGLGLASVPDYWKTVHSGDVTIHRTFIKSLVNDTVRLGDGTVINADYVIMCTGWTHNFSPFTLSLRADIGLPCEAKLDGKCAKRDAQADMRVDQLLPNLNSIPRMMPKEAKETSPTGQPWRLYRRIVSPEMAHTDDRTIYFPGQVHSVFTPLLCEMQALWGAAFLGVPYGYTQSTGRLLGNNFGVPGQNLAYDYIVVGGCTGGLAIATRLSEDPTISVAVVEAGEDYEVANGNVSQVPGLDGYNDRLIYYPQGKTLGGSSALNFMAYHRATIGTFKWWAEMVGDTSWLWDTVFTFYKKSPQFTPPNYEKIGPGFDLPYDASAFSQHGGPLQVSFANYQQPVSPFIAKCMTSAGIKKQDGFNSGHLNGHASTTVCVAPIPETRSSSEASFLQYAFMNTGLKVYQRTMADNILFDAMKKATGVVVTTDGVTYTLSASKEIVVSSGAFHSPQLLMVSGIGPVATLAANNIPAISTLEGVGQKLWDQVYFAIVQKVYVTSNSQLLSNPAFAVEATESYLTNQTGPLASVSGDLFGWEKVPQPNRARLSNSTLAQLAHFPSDWPEIEYVPIDIVVPPTGAAPTDNFIAFGVALLTPISRGNVTITSTDTSVKPLINPNWLFAKADQEVAVQAFRRIREIADYSGIVLEEVAPGPSVQSDADVLTWIQDNASLIYHASATCAMGKVGDPSAVIDSKTREIGVSGLRVVDASAFPFLPPGHPSAVVYMLAEKIANDILTG